MKIKGVGTGQASCQLASASCLAKFPEGLVQPQAWELRSGTEGALFRVAALTKTLYPKVSFQGK